MTAGSGAPTVRRHYLLEWTDGFVLRISSAELPADRPVHGVGRIDTGHGVCVDVDPLDPVAPRTVEARDGEAARVTLQGIFGWDSWPVLRDALNGADDLLVELDVRDRFASLAEAASVSWIDRWSPLPLRQELLDFELGARLVLACSAPAPRRRAARLLGGMAHRLPSLAQELMTWGPDVAPLLQAARVALYGSRHQRHVDAALQLLRVSEAAAAASGLDQELQTLLTSGLQTERAGSAVGRAPLALPVDWDRLPPRVVPGLVERPVMLDLAAGTVTVQALVDRTGSVVRPRDDLTFSVYRDGAPLPGLAGPLRLYGERYRASFRPRESPEVDGALSVDISVPAAVAAVKAGPVAERAARRRDAVREVTFGRMRGVAGSAAGPAGLTLAERGWLAVDDA